MHLCKQCFTDVNSVKSLAVYPGWIDRLVFWVDFAVLLLSEKQVFYQKVVFYFLGCNKKKKEKKNRPDFVKVFMDRWNIYWVFSIYFHRVLYFQFYSYKKLKNKKLSTGVLRNIKVSHGVLM